MCLPRKAFLCLTHSLILLCACILAGTTSLVSFPFAHEMEITFNEVGSWLPGKEKSALWVVSVAVDDTDKGELVEELNISPTSSAKGQRGEAGRQVLSKAWALHEEACLVLVCSSHQCLEDKIPQAGWMKLDIRAGVGCLVHFLSLGLAG